MTKNTFLKTARGFCIIQFLVVIIYVYQGGLERSEMFFVVISAVFALMLDGFCHTAVKAGSFSRKRKKLDKEFDELIRKLDDGSIENIDDKDN